MKLRNLLIGAGLLALSYSTPSFAQESAINKLKAMLQRAKEKIEQTDDYKKAREEFNSTSLKDIMNLKNQAEKEAYIFAVKNMRTYDPEKKRWVSLNDLLLGEVKKSNIGGDFGRDPVRTTATLLFDPDALNKLELFDDGSGNYMNREEAIKFIKRQIGEVKENKREFATEKRRFRERPNPSLEVLIDREFTMTASRRRDGWINWENLDEDIHFGNKVIRLTSSVGANADGGYPVQLSINCKGENNNAAFSELPLSTDRQAYGSIPKKGDKYLIYTSAAGDIELTITDVLFRKVLDDYSIKRISFRIHGSRKRESHPYLKRISRNNTEYKLLRRIKERDDSKIRSVVDSVEELDELSNLLDRGVLGLNGNRLYLRE